MYISRAFGPFCRVSCFGWSQLFIIRTSPLAGLAIVTVNYFTYFVELSQTERIAAALFIILLLAILNYVGRAPGRILPAIDHGAEGRRPDDPGITGLYPGLRRRKPAGYLLGADRNARPRRQSHRRRFSWWSFAYMGFRKRSAYSAGEMKDPRRTIPLTMFVGISAIVLIYVLANLLYHQTLGMDGVRTSRIVASDTAVLLLGPLGAGFIAITVMISTTGSMKRGPS